MFIAERISVRQLIQLRISFCVCMYTYVYMYVGHASGMLIMRKRLKCKRARHRCMGYAMLRASCCASASRAHCACNSIVPQSSLASSVKCMMESGEDAQSVARRLRLASLHKRKHRANSTHTAVTTQLPSP